MLVFANAARERTAPMAFVIAANKPKPIPCQRCVAELSFVLGTRSVTTQATPKIVSKIPHQALTFSRS